MAFVIDNSQHKQRCTRLFEVKDLEFLNEKKYRFCSRFYNYTQFFGIFV